MVFCTKKWTLKLLVKDLCVAADSLQLRNTAGRLFSVIPKTNFAQLQWLYMTFTLFQNPELPVLSSLKLPHLTNSSFSTSWCGVSTPTVHMTVLFPLWYHLKPPVSLLCLRSPDPSPDKPQLLSDPRGWQANPEWRYSVCHPQPPSIKENQNRY